MLTFLSGFFQDLMWGFGNYKPYLQAINDQTDSLCKYMQQTAYANVWINYYFFFNFLGDASTYTLHFSL